MEEVSPVIHGTTITLAVGPKPNFARRFSNEPGLVYVETVSAAVEVAWRYIGSASPVELIIVDGRIWNEHFPLLIRTIQHIGYPSLWIASPTTRPKLREGPGVCITWSIPEWLVNRRTDIWYRVVKVLVEEGGSNEYIGSKTGIATRTVKNHLHDIFENAGVKSRAQLIVKAVEEGWFS